MINFTKDDIPRESNQQAFGLNLLSPVGLCFEGYTPSGLDLPSLATLKHSKESLDCWDIKVINGVTVVTPTSEIST